ncbi:MAG: S49 family peptidase, partial [Candidatus Gribaldobacteria bacterium]|nr:S49 family peptidase [Candidatus Gribaldobacteria bacterium]
MKINELWLRCRKWSDVSILGYFVVGIVKIVFIFIIFALLVYGLYMAMPYSDKENPIQDLSLNGSSKVKKENCTVTGINIHGGIITYVSEHAEGDTYFDYDVTASEDVDWMITQANENPKIKAIIIEVDSGGGSPVAGEEIANAVKNSEKPVIAFIRERGASAAYWAISGADKIFASENSDVGSIGITMSYLNNVEWNKKEGYTYEQLSIGKYKDSGIPDKPLTSEEKAIFVRDMNII